MKVYVKVLFFIVFICNSYAQNNVIRYAKTNGLAHDICYSTFQDSKGYIWVATDNGLSKFDGDAFKNYTTNDGLSSNYVIDIKELSNGNLVLGTWRGGLNIFNTKTKEIYVNKIGPKKLSNIEVYKDTIYNLHDYTNNKLWVVNDSLLKNKAVSIPNNNSQQIYKYKVVDDTLYAFSDTTFKFPNLGINYLQNGKIAKTFQFLKDYTVTDLAKIQSNSYVASTSHELIFFTKKGLKKLASINTPNSSIDKIIVKNTNELIIRTIDDKGFKYAFLYDVATNQLEDLRKTYNIKSTISDIFLDHENNLWLATYGDGLYKIKYQNLDITSIYLEKNLIDLEFYATKTYALSNDSLYIFDASQLKEQFSITGYGKGISKIKDSLFITSIGNRQRKYYQTKVVEVFGYRYFYTPTFGRILVNDSIHLLDKGKVYPYHKLDYNIFDAFEFNNQLYFATNSGLRVEQNGGLKKEEHINSLIGKLSIQRAIVYKNSLFLGSENGLLVYQNRKIKHYTEDNGLVSNSINNLTLDHKNRLWIATQNGLSIFENDEFLNINEDSGLTSTYVSAIKEDQNDTVWITGNNGISIINNSNALMKSDPPVLNVIRDKLIFNYTAISYNRKNLTVQYKVNENPWQNLDTDKGMLDFNPFKPDIYNIKFRAKKPDSNWSKTVAFNFKITQPWYKKWWIISLFILFITALIIVLILSRLKVSKTKNKALELAISNKLKLEKELSSVRDNIAKDFHDDLGNKLARISILSSLLDDQESSLKDNDKDLVNQIASDADYLYKGTKDFIFSLNSNSNNLEEVVTYLSDFGEDYFRQFNIIFEVEKQLNNDVRLPYYWSKHIIYIFKEVMTNIVKHAKCETVNFIAEFNTGTLTICCEDDGIGFNNAKLNGNGLNNIRQRAKTIGCTVEISSKLDKGTKVCFKGKINKNT